MKQRILLLALGGLALLVAGHAWILWSVNPLLVVHEEARALGWEEDSLSLVGGGYESGLISVHAYGRFRPRDAARGREVYVKIARSTPLQDWQVVEYRVDR